MPSTEHNQDEFTGNSESRSPTRRRFLKAGSGATVTAALVSLTSGVAAAHFHGPEKPALNVDIMPDSQDNAINLDGEGVIPIAVLQTEKFDPTSQNVNYRFGVQDVVANGGGARPIHDGHATDVNDDGRCDLILHFRVEDTGFDGDEAIGHLHWEKGEKGAGHGLGGSDAVSFVDEKKQESQSTPQDVSTSSSNC